MLLALDIQPLITLNIWPISLNPSVRDVNRDVNIIENKWCQTLISCFFFFKQTQSWIRELNSFSHSGHNILLFVERLLSCVTGAKNTPPPLPSSSLPPSAWPARIVFLLWSTLGGGGEEGGALIQGVSLTSEWCHCDVSACNCICAAKLTSSHSESERAEGREGGEI